MTENLLEKLEERVMQLLTQLDMMRVRTEQLKHENTILRTEHSNQVKKLQGLISVLDAMDTVDEGSLSQDLLKGSEELARYDS